MKYAANNLPHNRGGVVISRSVGKAVERNRLRRVIMNFLSSNPNFLKGGTGRDFVFFVGSKAATEKQTNLSKELKTYGQLF
ncbi:MAG: ribonuclease P protein component [Patescibacteria group bacterium]|nr:ribonuclease P protein component [Patescibacteria group bacterium]MCL5224122.1 ribonuclease P protein component [Patescibacteria group bacterium]